MQYKNLPISDAHIHIFWDILLCEKEKLLKTLIDKFNYETVSIMSVPFFANRLPASRDFTENLSTFYLKSKMPEKVFAFAGLSHSVDEGNNTPEFFLKQIKFYYDAGFDGLKMMEGAPFHRHIFGSYDDKKYDLMYNFAEENQIPVVMHENAPEFTWQKGKSRYGTKPTWNEFHTEIEHILTKFPKLRLTLAHFGFMTEQPEFVADFLDKYKNVYLDLTPNQFMYLDFSKNPDIWQSFFEKYQDRLIYGTDIGSNSKDTEGVEAESLVHMVRGFFEKNKPFSELGYDFIPLPLQDNILRKIYRENMMRFYNGKAPAKLNPTAMQEELESVKKLQVFLHLNDLENLKLIETVFQ